MLPQQTAIHQVRLRCPAGHESAARQSATSYIETADLEIPRVAPSQIFIVRRLDGRVPSVRAPAIAPFAGYNDWSAYMCDRLDLAFESASRPRNLRVDSATEAIVFDDAAELMACIAVSMLEGRDPQWWVESSRPFVNGVHLGDTLAANIEYAPAVCGLLDRHQHLENAIRAIPVGRVIDLVGRLCETFELTHENVAVGPRKNIDSPAPDSSDLIVARVEPIVQSDLEAPYPVDHTPNMEVAAPWRALWQPTATANLSSGHELFCALSVGLANNRSELRDRAFVAGAVSRATSDNAIGQSKIPEAGRPTKLKQPSTLPDSQLDELKSLAPSELHSDRQLAKPASRKHDLSSGPESDEALTKVRDMRRQPQFPGHSPEDVQSAQETLGEMPELPRSRKSTDIPSHAPGKRNVDPDNVHDAAENRTICPDDDISREWPCDGIETSLGGVMFLVNAIEYLDLPECFEKDCRLSSKVGAAQTLEALALSLYDGTRAAENDSVWSVMSGLSGRAAGDPMKVDGFDSEALRLPPAWIDPIGLRGHTLVWTTQEERLVIASGCGLRLVDVPLGERSPRSQAADESKPYMNGPAPPTLVPSSVPPLPPVLKRLARICPAAFQRWVEFVAPYIKWRLAVALGDDSESWSFAQSIGEMEATIHVTDTHIDVVASIDSVRIPVRMAGLDRSPGWIPSLGKVVLFHYE